MALHHRNADVFNGRWSASRKVIQMRPHLWREMEDEFAGKAILEIGPGLRPTIRIVGSHFVDISTEAIAVLRQRGGNALHYAGGRLPFDDASLTGVFAFEVLEHVEEDEELLAEIARVLVEGGTFVFSVPLHMEMWSSLDESSAHVRRYEPAELFEKLRRAGFVVEKFRLSFGRRQRILVDLATWVHARAPKLSNAFLQGVVFPLHSAYERRFAKTGWTRGATAIPSTASGIRAYARLARGR